MPVPTTITDLSTNEALNSPAGSENVGSPGSVDNYFRAIQAILRQESLTKSWEVRGDVPTYIDDTSFSMPGDQTAHYVQERRLQANGAAIIHGTILSSSFNGIITTVVITPDFGVLDPTLYSVFLGVDPMSAAAGTAGGGVITFNTRTGAVVLTDDDVTDALEYVPANAAGQDFTGSISAFSGIFTDIAARHYDQIPQTLTWAAGSHNLDYLSGQSKLITLTGNVSIGDITDFPAGSIMRVVFSPTTFTIAWPSVGPATVVWPLGVTPVLNAGPLKKAIVVLEWDGVTMLGSATVY